MRKLTANLSLLLTLYVTGCTNEVTVPRFAGTIVSHVDSYGSGTGASSKLSAAGQMRTGFDYTDNSKTDWKADIKWAFLGREGGADMYRIEWIFLDGDESSDPNSAELSFDGESPAKLPVTDQLVVSIEPERSTDKAEQSDATERRSRAF